MGEGEQPSVDRPQALRAIARFKDHIILMYTEGHIARVVTFEDRLPFIGAVDVTIYRMVNWKTMIHAIVSKLSLQRATYTLVVH